jgi:hypothetical protein
VNHLLQIVTTKYPTTIRVLKRLLAPIYYRCRLLIFGGIGTLPWYIAVLLVLRRRSSFKFVEIGVSRAITPCGVAKRFTTSIQYAGFYLFENKDAFFDLHPDDRTEYDNPEYPTGSFSQASTLWRGCTVS